MDLLIHQNPVSFKLEVSKKVEATSFGGCALIREAISRLGLRDIMKTFGLKKMGYADELILEALILLMASGGRSLSDWEYLKGEMGFDRMFGEACPSVDTLDRYLLRLRMTVPERDPDAAIGQVGYTTLLEDLQRILIRKAWKKIGSPKKMTLDLDAMILETSKSEALYCYEKVKAYQPMNAYSPELGMVLAHEFRDGNVSPREGYRRIIERCRELLPKVRWIVRSDSAGYNNDFLDWMTGERIAYVMTVPETEALEAGLAQNPTWLPLILNGINLGEEIAEILYTPTFKSRKELHKRMNERRYFLLRKTVGQQDLFPVQQLIVTNDLISSKEKVIKRHRGRCGSVEYFHSQTHQLGMDLLPSGRFKVNCAWYGLGCVTHNLLRLLQHNLFPKDWKNLEITTLRFRFLRSVALVIKKARQVILRFCENHPIVPIYTQAWERLAILTG
jgi:hypothetical protein